MRRALVIAVMMMAGAIGACSSNSEGAPPAPAGNVQLAKGRDVWVARCARCHGAAGEGAIGPQLSNGKVLQAYPNVEDEIALVRNGKGTMPAWKDVLSADEIAAVVAYTREVLAAR